MAFFIFFRELHDEVHDNHVEIHGSFKEKYALFSAKGWSLCAEYAQKCTTHMEVFHNLSFLTFTNVSKIRYFFKVQFNEICYSVKFFPMVLN